MNKIAKRQYQVLANSGDLLEMFPEFEGKWIKDKKKFIEYFERNEEVLLDLDVEIDEEDVY